MKQFLQYTVLLVSAMLRYNDMAAQENYPHLARPGAKGIFVMAGDIILRTGDAPYIIERKQGYEKEFKKVAELTPVPSAETFKKNAEASLSWLPYKTDLTSYRLDSIWKTGMAAGNLKALKNIGYSLPVMAGFNLVWLDEQAEKGKAYQYRVTAGNTVLTSTPVLYRPAQVARVKVENQAFNEPQHTLYTYAIAVGENRPVWLEVYRSNDKKGFDMIAAEILVAPGHDTIRYVIKDTTAREGDLYYYFLKGYDALGNASVNSDTLLTASLDFVQMPLPQQVVVLQDSAADGISISWKMQKASLINMLTLYRSTNSVDGFEPIAVLSPDQQQFADDNVKPATAYFYYFEATYKMQDRPKRSTMFAGSYTDKRPPAPPAGITATGTEQGITISWENHDKNISGFWLYRAEQGRPLVLTGALIPAIDTITQYNFTDTDSLFNGGVFYTYAIRSYSTSHVESIFSDTAVARPLKNIPVPKPPLDVKAQTTNGKTWVTWDDVSAYDGHVAGYRLLRSVKKNKTDSYHPVDTIFCSVNLYVDTLMQPGEIYRYSVSTLSVLGVVSAASEIKDISPEGSGHAALPPPPSSVVANITQAGVQLNWEPPAVAQEVEYVIYRYERGKAPVKAGTASFDSSGFTDITAAKGKQYFYFVRSVTPALLEGDKSNEAMALYK